MRDPLAEIVCLYFYDHNTNIQPEKHAHCTYVYLQLVIRNVVFRDTQIRGNCEESYEEREDAAQTSVVHDCDKSVETSPNSSDRVGAVLCPSTTPTPVPAPTDHVQDEDDTDDSDWPSGVQIADIPFTTK